MKFKTLFLKVLKIGMPVMSLVSFFHDVITADKKHRPSVLCANKDALIFLFRPALVVRCETDDVEVNVLKLYNYAE